MNADAEPEALRVHTDRAALCRAVARDLAEVLAQAVADRGSAHAVLTGGGTGTGILEELAAPEVARGVDWARVHLWWGDERLLPAGDPERNEVQATAALLSTLVTDHGLPAENIHRMPELDPGRPADEQVDEAAAAYAAALAAVAPQDPGPDTRLPVLDVLLLGMGPDAHVASLFPGLEGPSATDRTVVGVTGSPKPPAERVSLTVEALNTARRLWFVVTGEDKADTVQTVRTAREANRPDVVRWPASGVSGTVQTLWHVDRAAAGLHA